MECIIAYRVGRGTARVVMLESGDSEQAVDPFVFDDFEAAIQYADANKLFQSGQADYQIIELDEL